MDGRNATFNFDEALYTNSNHWRPEWSVENMPAISEEEGMWMQIQLDEEDIM